jgi:hypothetical protein
LRDVSNRSTLFWVESAENPSSSATEDVAEMTEGIEGFDVDCDMDVK